MVSDKREGFNFFRPSGQGTPLAGLGEGGFSLSPSCLRIQSRFRALGFTFGLPSDLMLAGQVYFFQLRISQQSRFSLATVSLDFRVFVMRAGVCHPTLGLTQLCELPETGHKRW